MAGIRKKGDAYYCTFRFQGQRYYFAIGNFTEAAATAKGAEVDETLTLLERGRLTLPEGVPLADFVAAGGKAPLISAKPDVMTTRQLFDHYSATQANGTVERLGIFDADTLQAGPFSVFSVQLERLEHVLCRVG
jgi:hypothetical protein